MWKRYQVLSHFSVLQVYRKLGGAWVQGGACKVETLFEWKAITFSWAHQDQEMLLLVPGSQPIIIGHTQYLWGLAMAAVLAMFQMYLPLCFGYHGGCWCDNPHGRWWYRCSKICSEKCLGSWWRDWDPLQICTYKKDHNKVRDNGRQTLQEAQKKSKRLKLTVWLVHCVHILLTMLRNTRFIFLCEYINPINRTAH